ncbi:patatin family protein [bacterium D16-50]|nr:patatin family protein [bacterium D16-50]
MYQAGLVLEGGGMKGVYTAGVLDFFLDKEIEFSSVYGVSAGAVNMCSYLSKQRGRSRDVTLDYLDIKRYCSWESLITTGDLFNVQMCYHLIPEYLNPYDYETFDRYRGRAFSVATDIVTGKPEYFRIRDMKKDIDKLRASASLPLVSRNVKIGGRLYLDGGISDSIPLLRSVVDGNRKNVVVLTKEKGFVRKPSSQSLLLGLRYLRYPKVAELMSWRHVHYAAQTAYVERMRKSGQVFVIRPKKDIGVGRVEKNLEKLMELYRQGYEDAKGCYGEMMQFLGDVPDQ